MVLSTLFVVPIVSLIGCPARSWEASADGKKMTAWAVLPVLLEVVCCPCWTMAPDADRYVGSSADHASRPAMSISASSNHEQAKTGGETISGKTSCSRLCRYCCIALSRKI